ncbi:putative reverse transcriptase domain-containing protein [Tanacetum coccineum]
MDQKLKGYARSAENKRRLDNNSRDNREQQPVFKRQNVGGQNVARAYTAGNNEKKEYVGSLPYYNKCKLHHAGSCTARCRNYKRVGHITRNCTTIVTLNTQRASVGNQPGIVCYECGRPGHFRKDCPKLRNQNSGNKTGNKKGNKTGNQTGGNEATTKAYAIGGGGENPDSNVVIDTSYAVELADGRISETNVVLRGCTNKQEIETISLDDLYNNLKIYEPKISRSSSTSQSPQNVAFVSSNSTNSNSSTNEADNTAYGVSAAHTQSNPTSGDKLSDDMICAFLAIQPNSPQLAQEDLEQIDPDDLEEMDLQWEMAMLTIRDWIFIKDISAARFKWQRV